MLVYMYAMWVSHAVKLTSLSDQPISQINKEDLSQACGTFLAKDRFGEETEQQLDLTWPFSFLGKAVK